MEKLSKEDIEKKIKFHEKKAKYYSITLLEMKRLEKTVALKLSELWKTK